MRCGHKGGGGGEGFNKPVRNGCQTEIYAGSVAVIDFTVQQT